MTNPYMGLPKEEIKALIAEEKAKQSNPYIGLPKDQILSMIEQEKSKLNGGTSGIIDNVKNSIGEGISGMYRDTGRGLRGLSTGLASMKDAPNFAALGLHKMGLKETPQFYDSYGQEEKDKIDRWTKDELKPQTKGEEYFDTGAEAFAPFVLAPFTGGASLTGVAAKNIANVATSPVTRKIAEKVVKWGSNPYALTKSNIAGTAGSAAAVKKYVDNVEDPGLLGSLAAGFAGGVGGAKASRFIANPKDAAARSFAKAIKFNPEKYEQAKKLNIRMSAGDVSDTKWAPGLENGASYVPGSKGVLENFNKSKESDILRNIGFESLEDANKVAKHPSEHLAKKGAKQFEDKFEASAKKKKSIFEPRENQAIKNREAVDVSDIMESIARRSEGLATPAELKDFSKTPHGELKKNLTDYDIKKASKVKPSNETSHGIDLDNEAKKLKLLHYPDDLIKKILKSMSSDVPKAQAVVKDPSKLQISYGGLNQLRKAALDESRKASAPSGSSDVHRMLSSKRHEFMDTHGTKAEKEASRQYKAMYNKHLNKKEENLNHYIQDLTHQETDKDAFKKLGTNEKYAKVVMKGLDKKDRMALTRSYLGHIAEKGGEFDILTLSQSKPSQMMLRGFDKNQRKAALDTFDYINTHRKPIKQVAQQSTAEKNIWKAGKIAAIGTAAWNAPITSTLGYLGAKGGAKLWTNPNILERMNKVIKQKDPEKQALLANKLVQSSLVKSAIQTNQQYNKKKIP